MESLLAFFASFVLDTEVVRQIMRWDMVVLEKSPWYNEILDRGKEEGKQVGLQEGKQVGLQEGRQVGQQDAVLDILDAKFGPLSEEITTKMRDIRNLERLHQLNRKAALAGSLEEFLEELNSPNASA
ncbi:MAG TPA: hypothetical protein VFJ58_02590 [Armatimonadota bacterium]|nr:hypothetical protein [Armatimonadota bacterium]